MANSTDDNLLFLIFCLKGFDPGLHFFCAHITHWPAATLRGVQPIPVREIVTDSVRYIHVAMSGR